MRSSTILASLFTGALCLASLGCGSTKAPPEPQTPAPAPSQSPAPAAAPATPVSLPAAAAGPSAAPAGKEAPKAAAGKAATGKAAPGPSTPSATSPTPAVAKEPAPAPVAAPPKPSTATAPPATTEPNKAVEAPATSAHAKVGPEKCMMCHRVQYTSWNVSKHKTKGLDCEGCHGNGADYKAISVMKDRAAAVKAGLILPGLGFCKKCHVKAEASMLPLVHAHKTK